MRRPVYRWKVSHPDHGETEVLGPAKYEVVIAAAKRWGVPWTTIARACTIERAEEAASA